MEAHKYQIGQTVFFRPVSMRLTHDPRMLEFRVERLLPPDGMGNQYQLECASDGHRRVVRESELAETQSLDAPLP